MLINNRKGEISPMEYIFIIIISGVFLSVWIFILLKSQTVFVDERKINTQLLIKQALDGKCFSDEYGLIIENEFTNENIEECFKNLPDSLVFKINIDFKTFIFPDDESSFNSLANKCLLTNSNLCTHMKYPVRYLDVSGERMEILTLQIISTV